MFKQRSWVFLAVVTALGCSNSTQPGEAGGVAVTASEAAAAAPVDPGALVDVKMDSTVGVLLDEIPAAMRDRVAAAIMAKPASYWQSRAKMQVRLTTYRLVFREFYYGGKKQLPLPPENIWDITLTGPAQRTTVNGHDLVTVPYRFQSTLLTDFESPKVSENQLARVGGTWNEPFIFPLDPELVFQRTGYACMDEEDFPYNSVDSEEVDTFYDHTCTVEKELSPHGACHQTEMPAYDCVDALDRFIGKVETHLVFTRIPWSQARADSVRVYPATTDTADLEVYLEDFLINRIEYKYFSGDACELKEQCIGAPGWRRVLQFNSSDQNRGKQTLDIGAVDYYFSGKTTLNDLYNVFEADQCHGHFHFQHYGQFSLDAPGANVTNKQGFCLQSTNRAANNEHSPLHNPYGGCDYQGVAAGWVDQYKIGLPCQWVDITDVDTVRKPVTANLTFTSNPDGFLCEGEWQRDARGELLWEPTEFTNDDGETVYRPKCNFTPGWDLNNEHSYQVTIPKPGETYVTGACDRGQIGPLRNCGLKVAQEKLTCTPGANVTVRCTVPAGKAPQVARVCERSAKLNTSMACIERFALASEAVVTTKDIQVTCPAARPDGEPGGQISIYSGAVFPDADAAAGVSCTVL